ncbi:hypothetical protein [Ruegeria atlantica]|uniref:Uncharacterized protein n=1 Tax=Ruegeria atlantica TaxID=81569 RepID=A0A0P1EGV9_9RHOB|nr:hypothetical protein [Ruegeria atlantica]CUH49208.1 hypothetical protein RUA4292_03403 [Ruegeria atlantica]
MASQRHIFVTLRCQTTSNQSKFTAKCRSVSGTNQAPLGLSDGSVELEVISVVEMAFLFEMVVN